MPRHPCAFYMRDAEQDREWMRKYYKHEPVFGLVNHWIGRAIEAENELLKLRGISGTENPLRGDERL